MDIKNELHHALETERFILHYQPQFNLKTKTICGVEALLRLCIDDGRILLPEEFIAIAEDIGLIVPIGKWVLQTACRQYMQWQTSLKAIPSFKLAVNISPKQLQEATFLKMVQVVLDETKLPPENLELEITENPVIEDMESSASLFHALKKKGISMAIDDFGGEYSSLSYLRKLPIDTLKLDKSLIDNMLTEKVDAAIVSALTDLAHSLDIKIIAEGVKTKAQEDFLMKRHCYAIQSYYFCTPLSSEAFLVFLRANKK